MVLQVDLSLHELLEKELQVCHMKGLVWGGAGAGSLETTKLKLVTVGIQWRGRQDVIWFRWDERELEVQTEEDAVVYCSKVLKFKLGGLCSKPLEGCDLVIVEVGALEDVKVPLTLLRVSQQVVDMASNGGLT